MHLEITKDKGFERIVRIINGWKFLQKGLQTLMHSRFKMYMVITYDKGFHHGVEIDFEYEKGNNL